MVLGLWRSVTNVTFMVSELSELFRLNDSQITRDQTAFISQCDRN